MKKALPIFILSMLLLAACSSGRKALEKGNYTKAVEQSVKRLQSSPDNDDALATLPLAYKLAVKNVKGNIERARASADDYRWEEIVSNYETINYLYDQVQACPVCNTIVKNPEDATAELGSAREAAAEVRYQMALSALEQKQNRAQALTAVGHLQTALNYVSNYKDSRNLLDEALFYATLKVVVEPVQVPRNLQYSQDFFTNKMNEYLHRANINPYVRFYTPAEVEAENLPWVDHVVIMQFDQFTLGDIIINTENYNLKKDSVVLKDRRGVKTYGTVTAKFKEHTKTVIGSGVLDFKVVDENLNKVIGQEKFASTYEWSTQWASYNGDDRALTADQKAMAELREPPIPAPQFMFEQFANPIFDQVTNKIANFYRHY